MGYQSQEGQLAFITQAAAGAYTAVTNGVVMRTRGGSLGADRELIIPDPEIGGDRDIHDANLGPVKYSGDIDFYGRMDSLATLLYAALGSKAVGTTVGTTEGTDVSQEQILTPSDVASAMPLLSIQEDIAGDLETFQYIDGVVNSLSLECEPDGYLMGTAGFIARLASSTGSPDTPVLEDTTPLLVGTSMIVTIGGSTAEITRNFSMQFSNNYEDDVFELGSIALADLTPKRRELSMNFTIRPTTVAAGGSASDLWLEAVFGSTAATSPLSGAAAQKAINIVIASYAEIFTGSTTYFTLELDIPAANIKPFPMSPSGDDVVEFDVEVQAIRIPGNPLVTATVTNDLLSVR